MSMNNLLNQTFTMNCSRTSRRRLSRRRSRDARDGGGSTKKSGGVSRPTKVLLLSLNELLLYYNHCSVKAQLKTMYVFFQALCRTSRVQRPKSPRRRQKSGRKRQDAEGICAQTCRRKDFYKVVTIGNFLIFPRAGNDRRKL